MPQNLQNRESTRGSYRYGFQAQERDDEIKGAGNSVNYTYRMHDTRLGRFFAVDPLFAEYANYSPYMFSGNKVIQYVELEGLEEGNTNSGYDPINPSSTGFGRGSTAIVILKPQIDPNPYYKKPSGPPPAKTNESGADTKDDDDDDFFGSTQPGSVSPNGGKQSGKASGGSGAADANKPSESVGGKSSTNPYRQKVGNPILEGDRTNVSDKEEVIANSGGVKAKRYIIQEVSTQHYSDGSTEKIYKDKERGYIVTDPGANKNVKVDEKLITYP